MDCAYPLNWLVCRICLKNDGIENIFDSGQDLIAKIKLNGGIEIYENNSLPHKICNRCLLLLKASCEFRELCKHSELQIETFLSTAESTSESHLQTDENVATATDQDEQQEGCLFVDDQVDDYAPKEKPNQIVIEYVYSINELEVENETPLSPNVDQIIEEDKEYIFEAINEPTQDSEDKINNEDTCNAYAIDKLNVQDYEVPDTIVEETLFESDVESSVLHDEILQKPSKRKLSTISVGEKTKEDDVIYKCHYCDNVYYDKAKHAVHIKMHKNVKPHECEICSKRFSTTPQLSRHMNSHTGHRPYKCKYCEACFGDPSTKIKHERIHTNERPYKCHVCPKSFSYSNVLKVHMMVHTGEKPYPCTYCRKSFSQIHHRNSHEKRHRNMLHTDFIMNDADVEDEITELEIE